MVLLGTGKTTLVNLIASHTNRKIIYAQGSLLLQKSDILSLFCSVRPNDIIFIDEIHSMNKNIEELIYSAMEDNVIDVPTGPEGEKRFIRMKINPFTLIAATTQFSKISHPIRNRFGLLLRLNEYNIDDIATIILQSTKTLDFSITKEQAQIIAQYSQNIPRIANQLIKRIVDFTLYYNKNNVITNETIFKTLKKLSIFKFGLNKTHIEYLKLLSKTFDSKPISLDVIISLLNENKNMITQEIEPILLSHKLIEKTSRGRRITSIGSKYISNYNINPYLK